MATGFVPTQGVLPFLDPVFHIPSTILDLGHLAGQEPGVGDQKADPGEKLAPMPLDLGHYPARPAPTLRLVAEINDLDLDAVLGRSAYRTTEVRRHQPIQVLVAQQANEIGEALLFAIFVDLRLGKGGFTPKPETLFIPACHL